MVHFLWGMLGVAWVDIVSRSQQGWIKHMTRLVRIEKVQFVFAGHTGGHLSLESEVAPQPPLGLIILANYLQHHVSGIEVEVFDGKLLSESEIVGRLDADLIGFSTQFTNYSSTLSMARRVKKLSPDTLVIVGGMHATALAKQIMINNSHIDFVLRGEGEIPITKLLKGVAFEQIPCLVYRDAHEIRGLDADISTNNIDLDKLPIFDLDTLNPPFKWTKHPDYPAMSAFPVSGIRGCCRDPRCGHCSITTRGYRTMDPNKYWDQIGNLNRDYGIDFLFETGDTMSPAYLKALASVREHPEVAFRIYGYPGVLAQQHIGFLNQLGVRKIFMGIEDILVWSGSFRRTYKRGYTQESLVADIRKFGESEIEVIPGFVLGFPGETQESMESNMGLIKRLKQLDNVCEITVSPLLPIPGSKFFADCVSDDLISSNYRRMTGDELSSADDMNVYLLSQLFINRFTKIGYPRLFATIEEMRLQLEPGFANFGYTAPIVSPETG